jgi:hypothetical protein
MSKIDPRYKMHSVEEDMVQLAKFSHVLHVEGETSAEPGV